MKARASRVLALTVTSTSSAQGDRTMKTIRTRRLALGFLTLLIGGLAGAPIAIASAVEVGAPAPEFKLPATTGEDIALQDFKGKKWVFLEFYGADFAPT